MMFGSPRKGYLLFISLSRQKEKEAGSVRTVKTTVGIRDGSCCRDIPSACFVN